MAELASSMPTSGGLYYAAAVLAPPGWGPFAAWLTGWSNWMVQVTAAPSVDYGCGELTRNPHVKSSSFDITTTSGNDPSSSLNHEPILYSGELAGLSSLSSDHGQPRCSQLYADSVDR